MAFEVLVEESLLKDLLLQDMQTAAVIRVFIHLSLIARRLIPVLDVTGSNSYLYGPQTHGNYCYINKIILQ